MNRVSIESVAGRELRAGSIVRRLTDALGADSVAVNHYRVAPGDGLPSGLHAHGDQEEVFLVVAGEATFETCAHPVTGVGENRVFTVGSGEVVRFAPGEFQTGRNAGGDDLVALALGAPRDSEDVRVPFACPDCGDAALALDVADGVSFACPDCGSERVPADCPECGHGELDATLVENQVAVECRHCTAVFDQPPVRGEW